MKIFFVTSDIPYPGYTGGSVVNWSILNYLINKGHTVTLFSNNPRNNLNEIDKDIQKNMLEKLKEVNCKFVNLESTKLSLKKKNIILKLFSNKDEDHFPECYSSKEVAKIIKKNFDKIKPDLILCYGYVAIKFVKNIECKKAGWCESKFSLALSAAPKYTNIFNFFKTSVGLIKLYFFQKKMIKEFNKINYRFLPSKDFADDLVKLGAISCKHLMPPIYDVRKLFLKKPKLIEKERSFFKILIIGLMSNVNQSQISVLREYVFPIIEKNNYQKKIIFHFIGVNHKNLPDDFRDKDYVIGRGYVEDIYTELNNCDLLFSVTPKPFGFRVRLAEALCIGTSILTTRFDQISLPFLKDNHNCYIVDEIRNTGYKILDIYENQDKNLFIKQNARTAYEKNLSYDTAGINLENFILRNN